MYSTLHIADGAARSSTHSKRRSNNGLACQVVLGSLRGHRPSRHSPSDSSVANGAEASPEVFDSSLPPRCVASEDRMFCVHIPKLDSSAPCFIQSRTLAPEVPPCGMFLFRRTARLAPGT